MKVCVDIQAAVAQRAGVGRYTQSLVEYLGKFVGDNELMLFYFDFKRKGSSPNVPSAYARAVHWCPGRVIQKCWKTIGWPPYDWFAGKADLYHFPNFIRPPLTRGRSIVTIHDVSFLRHPEAAEDRNRRFLTAQISKTVRDVDAIITDTEFSKREICDLLNVSSEKVYSIHLGLSPALSPQSGETIKSMRAQLGLPNPYLLMVGTLEPRKNIPFLIDVYEKLAPVGVDLVIAGMRGWKYEPILERMQRSVCAQSIRYLEYVDDNWLPALYSGAELFVFPSLYEGFGFPPLESMACGTPVVASTAGALLEVLDDAAILVDGWDAEQWAGVIKGLLRDARMRAALREKGLVRAKSFNWEETARQTWDVYKRVLA